MNRALLFVVVVTVALAGSSSAAAMEKGDSCTLKTALKITKRGPAGSVEAFVERGVDIEVVSVSDGGQTLIRAGELKGLVATPDLDAACLGTLRSCTLESAVMMYEQNRSDSRSWRVKPGADVSVIKKGKTWAAVRVGDLQGFVKTGEMKGACAENDDEEGGEGVTEAVERGEGPGVLALPFHLEGAAPAGDADALLDDLFARLVFYRPDAGRLGADGSRDRPWKTQVETSASRAKAAETSFVVVGRLAIEPRQAGAPMKDEPAKYLLQLAIVDAKTGKVMKGIRAHPTMRPGDTWAELALAALLPSLPAAPGSKLPSITPKLEPGSSGAPGGTTTDGAKKSEAAPLPEAESTPWFANGWGYAALGVAVVAGAGAGVVGTLALDANDDANRAVETDPARAESRNTALTQAVASDALTVVAAGAAVASVVVFATRAGLE